MFEQKLEKKSNCFQLKIVFFAVVKSGCILHRHVNIMKFSALFEPRSEKNGLRGFRPGPIQTRLYSDRRWLEA